MKCPKCQHKNPPDSTFCGKCATRLIATGKTEISVTRTLETPSIELVRGSVFSGRYEVLEELGGGGMGKVYRVYDRKLEEEVALKLIRPEIAANRKAIERFKNEIKLARKITHKHVCRMHDLGEGEGTSYITMEYVPGQDLRGLIRQTGQLTVATAASLTRQVAEGLSEAHKLGIVHRDLKPGNIMIDKEGNAKIMDFGIARTAAGAGITGEGAIVGTPEYMSPEQVDGKEADQRSDIYALGIILFEMLTGRVPFEGETPFSIANKHKTEPPPIPKKLVPQIPEGLNKLILRCLEKDRAKRYQSAEELLTDLRAIDQSLPTTDRIIAKKKTLTSREITVKLTPKKLLIPTSAIIVLAIIAVVALKLASKKGVVYPPPTENSFAVISFQNRTGEKKFDYLQRVIADLLITKFEETGGLYVATWERLRDLLKQMKKENTEFINTDLGFELCRREGVKALVHGSFSKMGDMFVTQVSIQDVDRKTSLASARATGKGEDSIVSQIDDLGEQVFKKLSFSKAQLEKAQVPIAGMLTSSMEAYQHYLQGIDLIWNYKFEAAGTSFEKAVQIDPAFASAYRWLASAYYNYGDQKGALQAAKQAKLSSQRATEKERLYIEVGVAGILGEGIEKYMPALEELLAKYPKEKEAHYELGIIFGNQKKYDLAIKEMNRVVELDPNHTEAYNMVSIWYALLGNFEKAIDFGKKYASLIPKSGNPFDTMACIYVDWGKFDEAAANWKKSLDNDPNFYWAYLGLAYLDALRQDYPAAMKGIDRLLARNLPGGIEAEAFVLKGFLELWLGRFKQSLADFDRAAGLYKSVGNENTWFAEYCKATAYCELGEYELSQKYCRSALDFYANTSGGQTALTKPELAYNLAWNDLMLGRLDSAKMRLEEIKAPLPDVSRSLRWRAPSTEGFEKKLKYLYEFLKTEIAIREGSVDMERLRMVFADAPDYLATFLSMTISVIAPIDYLNFPVPLVKDFLARAYIQKGELDKAISAYERLVTLNPKSKDLRLIHPLAHYRLAKLYEQTGQKDKAKASYRKFLEFWKDADAGRPEVEDARSRLLKIEK